MFGTLVCLCIISLRTSDSNPVVKSIRQCRIKVLFKKMDVHQLNDCIVWFSRTQTCKPRTSWMSCENYFTVLFIREKLICVFRESNFFLAISLCLWRWVV